MLFKPGGWRQEQALVQVDQSLKPHLGMVTGPDWTQDPVGQSVFSGPLATVIGSGTSVGPRQAD